MPAIVFQILASVFVCDVAFVVPAFAVASNGSDIDPDIQVVVKRVLGFRRGLLSDNKEARRPMEQNAKL